MNVELTISSPKCASTGCGYERGLICICIYSQGAAQAILQHNIERGALALLQSQRPDQALRVSVQRDLRAAIDGIARDLRGLRADLAYDKNPQVCGIFVLR